MLRRLPRHARADSTYVLYCACGFYEPQALFFYLFERNT
nr:MAG TPA: hypothetical protein [Caudoviricetes sp.]